MSLHIPEEVIYIMMSFICILNMKDYVNYYGGDFFTLCRKLKDSKGLIAGKFPLFCMIGKYSMLNDEYHERAPNRSLMVPIEIFLNANSPNVDTEIECWIQCKTSYQNVTLNEYQCMNEIKSAHSGILYDSINTKMCCYHVVQINNEILDDTETCSVLKGLTSKYRGHIKNVNDFIQLTFESPVLKITFDGEMINVTDWFSVIFKEIHSNQLILYLPSSKNWNWRIIKTSDLYFMTIKDVEDYAAIFYAQTNQQILNARYKIESLTSHGPLNKISARIIKDAKEYMYNNLIKYVVDGFQII